MQYSLNEFAIVSTFNNSVAFSTQQYRAKLFKVPKNWQQKKDVPHRCKISFCVVRYCTKHWWKWFAFAFILRSVYPLIDTLKRLEFHLFQCQVRPSIARILSVHVLRHRTIGHNCEGTFFVQFQVCATYKARKYYHYFDNFVCACVYAKNVQFNERVAWQGRGNEQGLGTHWIVTEEVL